MVLERAHRLGVPCNVFTKEDWIAGDEILAVLQEYRIDFIKRHLSYAIKAQAEGCNCHGYLIWSFIDNLSAINAFKNRYGLLELDLDTYKRIPKKSLYWLKKVLEQGYLD